MYDPLCTTRARGMDAVIHVQMLAEWQRFEQVLIAPRSNDTLLYILAGECGGGLRFDPFGT